MIKFSLILVFLSISHAKIHHYQVEFMGINVAKVTMSYKDTIFALQPSIIVEFTATTESVSNFFYPVNNHYEIIHSVDSQQTLSFKKTTSQPGLHNTLITESNHGQPYYHDSQIIIPKESTTIFTLFHLLAHNLLDTGSIIIEREGLIYDGSLKEMDNHSFLSKYGK